MVTYLLYIGKSKEFLSKLGKIEGIQMVFAQNYKDAVTICISLKVRENLIVLHEQSGVKEDIANIIFFRKKFYQAYIILKTEGLAKGESEMYLKSGINDTINSSITALQLKQKVDFITKKQGLGHSHSRRKDKEKQFILPLWKRLFDIVFSSAALLALSPVFLITAIAIRLESKGSVIYKSKRVGSNYNIFDFLKFRSMYTDADKKLKELSGQNQYQAENAPVIPKEFSMEDLGNLMFDDDGVIVDSDMLVSDDFIIPENEFSAQQATVEDSPFVKIEKDPRVTKVGRVLRKYSLDELPQLVNILKGDMSVVGNRPLPLYEAERLTGDESIDRFMAPSGLTGLWQVEKRGDAGKLSAKERKELDLKYGKEFSFWLDMKILFKTFTAFIQKGDV